MKLYCFLTSIFLVVTLNIAGQNRFNKLTLTTDFNMYSYGGGNGPLNNTVRTGIGLTLDWETVDTTKKSGMIYEIGFCTTSGYYKALPGNNVLEVEDTHASLIAILPLFILFRGNITHRLGIGLGLSTLLFRDYYDENGTILTATSPAYPDAPAFKHWNPKIVFDYELALRSGKRSGFVLGGRYNVGQAGSSSVNSFKVTEGEGISVRIGAYYRLE